MESLRSVIELVQNEEHVKESDDLIRIREDAMKMLFAIYGGDGGQYETWMRATDTIPADKFVLAIAVIVRTHEWSTLPTPAEIYTAARKIAGLDLSRYIAGHYLPPAKKWPPYGYAYNETGQHRRLSLTGAQTLIDAGLGPLSLPESTP